MIDKNLDEGIEMNINHKELNGFKDGEMDDDFVKVNGYHDEVKNVKLFEEKNGVKNVKLFEEKNGVDEGKKSESEEKKWWF